MSVCGRERMHAIHPRGKLDHLGARYRGPVDSRRGVSGNVAPVNHQLVGAAGQRTAGKRRGTWPYIEGLRDAVRCGRPGIVGCRDLKITLSQLIAGLRRRRAAADGFDRRSRICDLGHQAVMGPRKGIGHGDIVEPHTGVIDVQEAAEIRPLRIALIDRDRQIIGARTREAAGLKFWIVRIGKVRLRARREERNRVVVRGRFRPLGVTAPVIVAEVG